MPTPESPLSRRRCAPLAGALALALFALSLGDAFAGGNPSKAKPGPIPQGGIQQLRLDPQYLPYWLRKGSASRPEQKRLPAIPAVRGRMPHAKQLLALDLTQRDDAEAPQRRTKAPRVRKVQGNESLIGSAVADLRAEQRPGMKQAIARDRHAGEESASVRDLRAHAAQKHKARPLSLPPLREREPAVDLGRVAKVAQLPVAHWRGELIKTCASGDAVRLLLHFIKGYDDAGAERYDHAGALLEEPLVFAQQASFDAVWQGELGLGYRPLQVFGRDVRGAIEQAIDDPTLDTSQVDSALIALPRPMRMADLPQPERIAAVIARSTADDDAEPRYVMIARLHPADADFTILHIKKIEDGSRRLQLMPGVDESALRVDRVEYVMYRGPADS